MLHFLSMISKGVSRAFRYAVVSDTIWEATVRQTPRLDCGCFCVHMLTMPAMLIVSGSCQLKEWRQVILIAATCGFGPPISHTEDRRVTWVWCLL